jgi:hypothetical protein
MSMDARFRTSSKRSFGTISSAASWPTASYATNAERATMSTWWRSRVNVEAFAQAAAVAVCRSRPSIWSTRFCQ